MAVLRVFVDQVRAVAVGDKNRAVGRDIDSGGIGPRAVGGTGFVVELEDDFSVEVEFANAFAAGGVEEFLSVLLVDGEAVEAARGLTPTFDKGAIGLIDDDAVRAVGGDIDFAGLVHRHAAVGGADVHLARDVAPVEDGFVNPVALPGEPAVLESRGGW